MVDNMSKPTYYLWRNEFKSEQEFEEIKTKYRSLGFRVVTFLDGSQDKDINEGIRAVIRNHYKEIGCL